MGDGPSDVTDPVCGGLSGGAAGRRGGDHTALFSLPPARKVSLLIKSAVSLKEKGQPWIR